MSKPILTIPDVIRIKEQLMAGRDRKKIAADHGVSLSRIGAIATERERAKIHVEGFTEWTKTNKYRGKDTALKIMDMLCAGEHNQYAIARACGCAQSSVSTIARGKTWLDLDHPWAKMMRSAMRK